jgi:hypothetical protein
VNLQPDTIARVAQLESADTTWEAEVPVPPARATGEPPFATDHQAQKPAVFENLGGRTLNIEFEHEAI